VKRYRPTAQGRPAAPMFVLHALQGQGAFAADMQAGHALLQELQGTVDPEVIVRERHSACQAHDASPQA